MYKKDDQTRISTPTWLYMEGFEIDCYTALSTTIIKASIWLLLCYLMGSPCPAHSYSSVGLRLFTSRPVGSLMTSILLIFLNWILLHQNLTAVLSFHHQYSRIFSGDRDSKKQNVINLQFHQDHTPVWVKTYDMLVPKTWHFCAYNNIRILLARIQFNIHWKSVTKLQLFCRLVVLTFICYSSVHHVSQYYMFYALCFLGYIILVIDTMSLRGCSAE